MNADQDSHVGRKSTPDELSEWVEPCQFLELAVSNRRLWRCDRPWDGILGLFDPATGARYVVSSDSLRNTQPSGQR